MKTVLTALYNTIGSLSPTVKAVLAGVTAYLAFNTYMNEIWADLFARVDGVVSGTFAGADFSPLGLLNFVFPIDTLLTFLVSYGALKAVCATVRIVKSFVPTVA